MVITRRWLFVLGLAAVFATPGCGGLFGDGDSAPRRALDTARGGYTIAVDGYAEVYHEQYAQQQMASYAAQSGLTGFWVNTRGDKSYVCFGRYGSADDPAIERDMQRLRAAADAGRIQTRMMTVLPYEVTGGGAAEAYHMDRAHPETIYTLLISVYDDRYSGDPRVAAEREAAAWRAQDQEAYYYHSGHESAVLIGAYYHGAFVQKRDAMNRVSNQMHPVIVRLRQELGVVQMKRNGEPMFDEAGGVVESELIRVPGR